MEGGREGGRKEGERGKERGEEKGGWEGREGGGRRREEREGREGGGRRRKRGRRGRGKEEALSPLAPPPLPSSLSPLLPQGGREVGREGEKWGGKGERRKGW